MSFKRPGEIVIITSTISADVSIGVLNNFLIPSIENWFGDEVIFQDNNASYHRAKGTKAFFQEKYIKSIAWPTYRLALNPIENLMVEISKKWSMRRLPPLKIYQLPFGNVGTNLLKKTTLH